MKKARVWVTTDRHLGRISFYLEEYGGFLAFAGWNGAGSEVFDPKDGQRIKQCLASLVSGHKEVKFLGDPATQQACQDWGIEIEFSPYRIGIERKYVSDDKIGFLVIVHRQHAFDGIWDVIKVVEVKVNKNFSEKDQHHLAAAVNECYHAYPTGQITHELKLFLIRHRVRVCFDIDAAPTAN